MLQQIPYSGDEHVAGIRHVTEVAAPHYFELILDGQTTQSHVGVGVYLGGNQTTQSYVGVGVDLGGNQTTQRRRISPRRGEVEM